MKLKMGWILMFIALLGLSACSSTEETIEANEESTIASGGEESSSDDSEETIDHEEGTEVGQGNKGGNSTIEIDWSLVPEQTVVYVEDYTEGEMLNLAIQDEFAAKAEYELIISIYGDVSPFTSILNAELSHIESLISVYNSNGYVIPNDESESRVVSPTSLIEAIETGIQAEVNNIAMYDAFLKLELADDIRASFEMLKAGSESHLESFVLALQKQSTETDE